MSKVQKLYSVTATITVVVVATDMANARAIFRDAKSEIIADQDHDVDADHEITCAADLPDGWDVDCLPYGTTHDKDIGFWIDTAPEPIVLDTKTIDMFAGVQP